MCPSLLQKTSGNASHQCRTLSDDPSLPTLPRVQGQNARHHFPGSSVPSLPCRVVTMLLACLCPHSAHCGHALHARLLHSGDIRASTGADLTHPPLPLLSDPLHPPETPSPALDDARPRVHCVPTASDHALSSSSSPLAPSAAPLDVSSPHTSPPSPCDASNHRQSWPARPGGIHLGLPLLWLYNPSLASPILTTEPLPLSVILWSPRARPASPSSSSPVRYLAAQPLLWPIPFGAPPPHPPPPTTSP